MMSIYIISEQPLIPLVGRGPPLDLEHRHPNDNYSGQNSQPEQEGDDIHDVVASGSSQIDSRPIQDLFIDQKLRYEPYQPRVAQDLAAATYEMVQNW